MENESRKFGLNGIILGMVLIIVVAGMGLGFWWCFKQLSLVKRNQLRLQGRIEDTQDSIQKIAGKIVGIEQEQLKLRDEMNGVQNDMEELVGDMAETIEQNQLELRDMIENLRENVGEISSEIAAIRQNQLKFEGMIERIAEEMLPGDLLEVISVEPSSPAVLAFGEKLRVKIRYCIASSDSAQIWARPYTHGRRTSRYRAHGSPFHKKGCGEIEGYFFFENETVVDEVRIEMVDSETREALDSISYKIDARWVQPKISKRKAERIFIDVNNADGEMGWKEEYVIKLKSIDDISRQFGVNWYRPHRVARISTEKPDLINTLPKFRHEMQRYLTLRLGDAENNEIVGVMDFRKPDKNHFPFDLYLDRDRDGDLVEDFIEDRKHIEGISVPYKDGTTENYALNLYSYSTSSEPIGVAYQSHAGRYGILEADKKRIQILVLDNSGNGIFNDDDDVILLDWDMDGKIDGSHRADDDRPLYSLFELPGGKYRVVEFDAPGRRMILRRQKQGWFKLW